MNYIGNPAKGSIDIFLKYNKELAKVYFFAIEIKGKRFL